MKAKFDDSCFDFMCKIMANRQKYLDLKTLGTSSNEKHNFNFSNEKLFILPCLQMIVH